MAFSEDDISDAFQEGLDMGATHMLVIVDRFPFPQEDYVVYVMPDEDVKQMLEEYSEDMQEVIEVYSMKVNKEQQLKEDRAFHLYR